MNPTELHHHITSGLTAAFKSGKSRPADVILILESLKLDVLMTARGESRPTIIKPNQEIAVPINHGNIHTLRQPGQ